MEHRTRTRLVAALVLASVFASGVLLGYAADRGAAVAVASVSSDGERGPTAEGRRRVPVYELMEPTDPDLAATVQREVLEETGIDLRRSARHLGRLDEIQGVARGRQLPLVISPCGLP